MPTIKGEPEYLKLALEQARREGRLREGSVPAAPAGSPRPKKKPGTPEAAFEAAVILRAHLLGWKVVTFRKVRIVRPDGTVFWSTPFGADGVGFFDTFFARERVFFAEMKVRGRWRPEQKAWFELLTKAGQEVYLWRPRDWDTIERTLA